MLRFRFFQALAIALFLSYLVISYSGWIDLDTIFPFASYVFDFVFGGVVLVLFRNWAWSKDRLGLGASVAFFFAWAAGFAVYEASGVLGYHLPFAMKDPLTVLILLLVGPFIEEWVFRGALWRLLEVITGSVWPAFLISSVLFSYAHYYAIHSVDPSLQSYVRYQAIYTLGLGLFCGGIRLQHGWRSALVMHVFFNFGFWLGSF
jgi:membrane protease YdiL (CAAX protease family)